MEKPFLLYLSVHWGDLIELIKKSLSYTLKPLGQLVAAVTSFVRKSVKDQKKKLSDNRPYL